MSSPLAVIWGFGSLGLPTARPFARVLQHSRSAPGRPFLPCFSLVPCLASIAAARVHRRAASGRAFRKDRGQPPGVRGLGRMWKDGKLPAAFRIWPHNCPASPETRSVHHWTQEGASRRPYRPRWDNADAGSSAADEGWHVSKKPRGARVACSCRTEKICDGDFPASDSRSAHPHAVRQPIRSVNRRKTERCRLNISSFSVCGGAPGRSKEGNPTLRGGGSPLSDYSRGMEAHFMDASE